MYLRERYGGHVATLATATPIANSITEAHVMQRYLRPDLLADAGVEHFDQWAATFGQTVTEIEMAPTGGGNYRMNDPLRALPKRPGDAADLARLRGREDRRGPRSARPRARTSAPTGSAPRRRS